MPDPCSFPGMKQGVSSPSLATGGGSTNAIGDIAIGIRPAAGVSYPRLDEIVRGKRGVTPDTALRLARVTGMGADFRLGLQQDWDLWHALATERAAAIALLEPLPRPG